MIQAYSHINYYCARVAYEVIVPKKGTFSFTTFEEARESSSKLLVFALLPQIDSLPFSMKTLEGKILGSPTVCRGLLGVGPKS